MIRDPRCFVILAALGCCLVAGFFYAFSVCIMKSLARLPQAQGIAAMNSINVVVINPWFLTLFFGSEGGRLWADYLVSWTRRNHVRTIASLAAAALLTTFLSSPGR